MEGADMTITTEEAELLAERVEDEGGLSITADALRDLAAERDALRAENARLREALEGIEEYWNGAAESAVDAAEECRDRARAALGEKE
jgi:hypothetical protein